MLIVDWWSEGLAWLASFVDAAETGEAHDEDVVRRARAWLDSVPEMRARYGPPVALVLTLATLAALFAASWGTHLLVGA